MPIKSLTPDRHLQLIKRILHHKVRIKLIDLPDDGLDARHERVREQQELRPRERLEAGEAEFVGFEDFEACDGGAGDGERVGCCCC